MSENLDGSYQKLYNRIEANSGLIFVNTFEEERFVRELKRKFPKHSIQFWSCCRGLVEIKVETKPEEIKFHAPEYAPDKCRRLADGSGDTREDVLMALNVIESESRTKALQKASERMRHIYVLFDADKFFQNPITYRYFRDIVYLVSTSGGTMICTGPGIQIPPELQKDASMIDLGLPTFSEVRNELIGGKILNLIKSNNKAVENKQRKGKVYDEGFDIEKISNACLGLTQDEIINTAGYSLTVKNTLDLDVMLEEKKQIISKNDILEFWNCPDDLSSVGGFDNLKEWFGVQMKVMDNSEAAAAYHCAQPKGMMILGVQGSGKGQPLHYPVKMEDGTWKTIGSLKVGDNITSPKGNIEKIKGVYDKGIKPTYELTFADGRKTECCEDHLWKIYNKNFKHYKNSENGWIVCDTKKLIDYISSRNKTRKFYVPLVEQDNVKDKKHYIDPYILGILIGDGCLTQNQVNFTNSEKDIVERVSFNLDSNYKITSRDNNNFISLIKNDGHTKNKYKEELKKLGLMGKFSYEKFVPDVYKNASFRERIGLIKGLMDSDGSADGNLSYSTTSEQLAKDVVDIVRSIGGIAYYSSRNTKYTYKGKEKDGRESYRVNIRYKDPKALVDSTKHKNKLYKGYQYNDLKLEIIDIKRVEDQEIRCIYVDSDDHLYITNDHIVTHNTYIAKAIARQWGKGIIKLDMGRVFAGLVGESEKRMRMALAQAEAAGGVIIIDEIDKGLAGAAGSDRTDGGTTKRVIGTLLTWMQEPHPGLIIVATANDISQLINAHPELFRSGRLDKIWFSDVPSVEERKTIFKIHLEKRGRDSKKFDLDVLAATQYDSKGKKYDFTGAEIEHAIKETIGVIFARNLKAKHLLTIGGKYDIKTEDIVEQLKLVKPITMVAERTITSMRRWAKTNASNVSSDSTKVKAVDASVNVFDESVSLR